MSMHTCEVAKRANRILCLHSGILRKILISSLKRKSWVENMAKSSPALQMAKVRSHSKNKEFVTFVYNKDQVFFCWSFLEIELLKLQIILFPEMTNERRLDLCAKRTPCKPPSPKNVAHPVQVKQHQ